MNPRQRRLRRQRRKARVIEHELAVGRTHEELRRLKRLAAQADAKAQKQHKPSAAAIFAQAASTLPKPPSQ